MHSLSTISEAISPSVVAVRKPLGREPCPAVAGLGKPTVLPSRIARSATTGNAANQPSLPSLDSLSPTATLTRKSFRHSAEMPQQGRITVALSP